MRRPTSDLWAVRKAGTLHSTPTFPHRPQARPRTRKVLPMSLDCCVTYVPGRFTIAPHR
jgi:hypothetical protein